jgi:predicted O-linked N-acetylglucosamine transferase (SPINDLY family)
LSAVAAVLRTCPQAAFLWSGRERLTGIQSRLQALGVAERCYYIGWVDTKLYAQVMDVFLDSFPFPCAFTLYEAMAAGKPVVTYASPEAAETGLHGLLGPLLAGESGSLEEQAQARELFGDSLYLCAGTPQAYVEMASRLVRDARLRRAAGEANRRFVAKFLSDRGRTARTLATHLVELIGEAQGRR